MYRCHLIFQTKYECMFFCTLRYWYQSQRHFLHPGILHTAHSMHKAGNSNLSSNLNLNLDWSWRQADNSFFDIFLGLVWKMKLCQNIPSSRVILSIFTHTHSHTHTVHKGFFSGSETQEEVLDTNTESSLLSKIISHSSAFTICNTKQCSTCAMNISNCLEV